jgi:acetate kinase
MNNHEDAVHIFLKELIDCHIISSLDEIEGAGHRIVHGGPKYTASVIVDDSVLSDIGKYSDLAPLHNPAHVLGIKAIKKVLPQISNVVVFDTAFHQTMDEEAYLYPVPYDWYKEHDIRKYGFHGTSHKYVSERVSNILNRKDLKIISCHLGSGASITAIKDGKCIDTSMGFTPMAGIMMGTRCGDIDVSIIPHIMKDQNKSIDEVMNDLNKNSGLLGISGVSADARDIQTGIKEGNERCLLARNMFVRRIANYISMYYTILNGVDVIIFTAGIGSNDPDIRKCIIDRLKVLGITINEEINSITIRKNDDTLISASDSKIMCYVIPTDEEYMIANETYTLLEGK